MPDLLQRLRGLLGDVGDEAVLPPDLGEHRRGGVDVVRLDLLVRSSRVLFAASSRLSSSASRIFSTGPAAIGFPSGSTRLISASFASSC
jgi:hypothetical protein